MDVDEAMAELASMPHCFVRIAVSSQGAAVWWRGRLTRGQGADPWVFRSDDGGPVVDLGNQFQPQVTNGDEGLVVAWHPAVILCSELPSALYQ